MDEPLIIYLGDVNPLQAISSTLESFSQLPVPNDPRWSEIETFPGYTHVTDSLKQWGTRRVGAPYAWDISKGRDIQIAIIDEWLEPSEGNYPGNALHPDMGYDPLIGDNRLDNAEVGFKYGGHGLLVASVAGSLTDNALHKASLGWNVRLRGYDYLATGTSIRKAACLGVYDVPGCNPADVINMSFISFSGSQDWRDALEDALLKGVVPVAAAGNYHGPPPHVLYPCAYAYPSLGMQVICVSGVAPPDIFIDETVNDGDSYNYSHCGPETGLPPCDPVNDPENSFVDAGAPGYEGPRILTATLPGVGNCPAGGNPCFSEGYCWGTSCSTPLTSAAVALMLGINPNLTPDNIYSALISGTQKIGQFPYDVTGQDGHSWNRYLGYGRLNANHSLKYVIENFGVVVPADETMTLSNDTYDMQPGTRIVVNGVLNATNVTFQRAQPTQYWDGVFLDGQGSELDNVTISGAQVGVEVSALNAVIKNSTLTGNRIGVLTDFLNQQGLNARSTLTIENSEILDSGAIGLHARHANVEVTGTTISGSGYSGVVVEDADLVPFTNNAVHGNGTLTGNGISVISGGDVTMGPAAGFGGLNTVMDNANHELSVTTGGTLLAGTQAAAGDNSVYKTGGNPAPPARYVYNGLGQLSPVRAECTWWGAAGGPPTGAFTGVVDFMPFLFSPPPSSCGAPLTSGRGASAGFRGGDWHTWLQGEIIAARLLVADAPVTEDLAADVGRLAHLQRLDREDDLGEREATMAELARLRGLLDGEPTEAGRAVASVALAAEVRAALYEQRYSAARELLGGYRAKVEDSGVGVVLDLAAVSLFEQEGAYASALESLEAVIAALPPEEEGLARELHLSAEVIASHTGQHTAEPLGAPGAPAAASSETPTSYALHAAYPNPFNPSVSVPFSVPDAASVVVALYDVLGRRVAVLADARFEAGRHTLRFDTSAGLSTGGAHLASGVYVLRAVMESEVGDARHTFSQRLTLLR